MLTDRCGPPVDPHPGDAARVVSSKGTYILVLHLPQNSAFTVGKLGHYPLPAGFYAYAGSALGPGGLQGRLGHHLRPVRRPRWHLDYLRRGALVTAVWWSATGIRREHTWAALNDSRDGGRPRWFKPLA
jgi:Uri superfamily endonuclease